MNKRKAAGADTPAPKTLGTFWVYVIELDAAALADRDQGDLGKGAVYVGYTSHDPEVRLAKHQVAVHPAAAVFRRMKDPLASRLRMDLSLYAGPYATTAEARRNEKRTHNRFVSDGYKVFGDKGKPIRAVKKPHDEAA